MIDTRDWERTPRGKIACPDCGGTGWPVDQSRGPSWLDKHADHIDCAECGKTCTRRGLKAHQRHCLAVPGVDYTESVCPVCGTACDFGPECRDQIGEWPGPVWGSEE